MYNNEVWLQVVGYEKFYEVSNMGRVRGLDRVVLQGSRWLKVKGIYLKPIIVKNGYCTVQLIHPKCGRKGLLIHRLVFSAFGQPIPIGYDVHHIDEDKTNNRFDNLKILTKREHMTLHSLSRPKSSSFIGVVKWKEKWKAEIQVKSKKRVHLGMFISEIEAANAYKDALKSIEEGTEIRVYKKQFTYVCFKNREKRWCATYKCKKVGMYDTEKEALEAVSLYIRKYNEKTLKFE